MSRELFEHFLRDDTRVGPAPDGAFTGAAGGAACGDLARVSLQIRDGRVERATFDAEGCGATRAATAAVTEMVETGSVLDAARIGADEVEAAIGGLTSTKRHAAVLAADALHRCLATAAASTERLATGDFAASTEGPADPTRRSGPSTRTRPGVGARQGDSGAGPEAHAGADAPGAAPRRVAVAMSGGVDSAVAALLERERGADVVAITVKLWTDPETDGAKACCSPEAVLGARAVAHSIGVPHLTLDLEEDFRRRVVGHFLSGYTAGATPNPCIVCNGEVRIAAMLDLAERLGATHLVTGHYARIVDDGDGPLLATAADSAKDQSYMLAALPTDLLARLRFPLTDLSKSEVREIAARNGLAVAKKPESQDLCFLAGQGKSRFLSRHAGLRERRGAVLDRSGRQLGTHQGHHNFTVGQRRGIGVSAPEALYVVATDAERNTITVGTRDDIATLQVHLRDALLHRDGDQVDGIRLRYHSRALPAKMEFADAGRHDRLSVDLGEAFDAASPGQTAVLLAGESIVGHGTIVSA